VFLTQKNKSSNGAQIMRDFSFLFGNCLDRAITTLIFFEAPIFWRPYTVGLLALSLGLP
jgi:hypothetical protein